MYTRRLLMVSLCAGAMTLAASAADAAVRVQVAGASGIAFVQDNAKGAKAEKSKKAKGSKETGASQSSERSNASGAVRGKDRAQDVQGLQDSGKGSQQRGQRPSK